MNASFTGWSPRQLPALLRGDPEPIGEWIARWNRGKVAFHVTVIVLGAGLFGAAVGLWRDPAQALYAGIKFPLIVLLTVLGNGLLNGMLAPLLGLNLRFRQSLTAILASFAIAAAILGAFSPLAVFLVWNAPPLAGPAGATEATYRTILLAHVAVIAFAGVTANLKLLALLRQLGGGRSVAWRVLIGWLAGNLFLGSQLAWILRPFIGSPGLPVQFLREAPLQGNFYEAVFRSLQTLFFQ